MSKRRIGLAVLCAAALLWAYALSAYVLVPAFWQRHESQPRLTKVSMVSTTKQGIPADPFNVGLVGTRDEVIAVMKEAGWLQPDPITLKSSTKIVGSVALHHSYLFAPVSSLFYQGRRQDLAFEKQQGPDARRRHHVRFWMVLSLGTEGRPVWLGATTFDKSVGLSHFTGQITHHISPDVDTERNFLIDDLTKTRRISELYQMSGVGPTFGGRNGGGDRYYSDGEVRVAVIAPGATIQKGPAKEIPSSPLISVKDSIWGAVMGTKRQ